MGLLTEEEIFAAALQKAPEERRSFLDRACEGDPHLRGAVERLLAAHDHPDSFLECPLGHVAIAEPLAESPGMVIGPYKLLEQIGEGGFGVVFMAEQQHPVRRKVALKVVKPGMDTRQVIARFEAERQALALMDHPNIARVFDGGETASNRPYFVMELVPGIPLTDFCDQTRPGVIERLELLLSVCQAVHHAHQKGIIHRDLKPANVLVTLQDGKPLVKVIDFGIAKATREQLTDKTLFTNFAQMIGTPLYMSPEQAQWSAVDVDTRSDIYSLGVMLFELLTGTTPLEKERLKSAGFDEIRRLIREEEPETVSARLAKTHREMRSAERGMRNGFRIPHLHELDWIVMKALDKDRNRRYESAAALAADVERYLRDEPVLACPPSAAYRLRKFVRRHRGPVVAASLLLLALTTGIVGTTWGMIRASYAERAAVNEALLKDRALQEKQAALDEAETILNVARQSLDEYTQLANQLADQPLMQPLRRELLLKALKFYEELAKQKQTDPVIRLDKANANRSVGSIQYLLGQNREAAEAMRQAIDLYRPLMADFPENAVDLCGTYTLLQQLLVQTGQFEEASQALKESIDFFEKMAVANPDIPIYKQQLPKLQVSWARFVAASGTPQEAQKALRQAIDEGIEEHRLWYDLGYVQLALADHDGYRQTCDSLLQRFGDTENVHKANTIAWVCVQAPDAVADPERVVALAEKAVAGSHTVAANHRQAMLNTLGTALYRARRFDEAVARLNEAVGMHSKGGTPGDWFLLAMAHAELGDQTVASQWYEKGDQWMNDNQATLEKSRRLAEELRRFHAEAAQVLGKDPTKPK